MEALDRSRLGGRGWAVEVVTEIGSTNAELVEQARAGAPHGSVLAAEHQTAGRGRLDRAWVSAPYAGLTFSILLRPIGLPTRSWGWVPLLVGVAVAETVATTAGPVGLKWPNDLQLGTDRRKAAGILASAVSGAEPAFVVGVGLNVRADPARLDGGTALADHGPPVDRSDLLLRLLASVERRYAAWADAGWEVTDLRAAYLARCTTVGSDVAVQLPGRAEPLTGHAVDVDVDGRLVVEAADGRRTPIGAGDVVRVRPTGTMDGRIS